MRRSWVRFPQAAPAFPQVKPPLLPIAVDLQLIFVGQAPCPTRAGVPWMRGVDQGKCALRLSRLLLEPPRVCVALVFDPRVQRRFGWLDGRVGPAGPAAC